MSSTTNTNMKFYTLKVASNREDYVRDALERKVKLEKLEERVGRILVPTVKEKRMKGGSAKILEKKQYPGYVFVEMEVAEDGMMLEEVFFLIKETTGVGDFISSGNKPIPMEQHEVDTILAMTEEADDEEAGIVTEYQDGDSVKIKDGPFENFEGVVKSIDAQKGKVNVEVTIFGRPTPLELEYWQIEKS